MAVMESPTDRTKTVSSKLSGRRLEQFEAYCDEHGVPKTEAIRRGIDELVDAADDHSGRVPPDDDDLAKAWRFLYRITNGGGEWVRQDRAQSQLAQQVPGYNKNTSYKLLRDLAKRSYIKLSTDAEGQYSAVYVHE